MHKKDYVTFARMIRTQRHIAINAIKLLPNDSEYVRGYTIALDAFTIELSEIFASDNPQFNTEKFIKACTVDTNQNKGE